MIDQKSIAVLPFLNLSSDLENEYFSDGITEEIILALSGIKHLKVTSRTSSFAFKNKQVDIRLIGNQLGVSTVLEGSIRKAGKRVRIAAQLSRTDDGFQIWAQKFDRDLVDIFELQDEISILIAEQIRENFGHIDISEHLVDQPTANMDAYDYFLKGRFYQLKWEKESFLKAVHFYQLATQQDPNYAQAYFGLYQCYGIMASWNLYPREEGYHRASEALQRGVALNKTQPDYFFSLNYQALWVEWDYPKTYKYIKKALELSPNNTEYLESAAELYLSQGAFKSAEMLIKKAIALNPLSANHHYTYGSIFYYQGHYNKALEAFEKSLSIDPTWVLSLQTKAFCYILGCNLEALNALVSGNSKLIYPEDFTSLYHLMHPENGEPVKEFTSRDHGYYPWEVYIPLYSGDVEKAADELERGIHGRSGQFINFKCDPLLAPLHQHKCYRELYQKNMVELPPASTILNHADKEAAPKMDEAESVAWLAVVDEQMEIHKTFMDDQLSLKKLAKEIKLHSNVLSWLLNEKLEMNFNDYVNSFRLKEFQERALLPDAKNYTLLGLAFESGFSSKSTFNDYFKKKTGLTPRAWVKAQSS